MAQTTDTPVTLPQSQVIDGQGRPQPPMDGNELATLLGFLDYERATFEWKCRGLSDDQLRQGLHPTTMTLGGMLKHLAYAEDVWFTKRIGGQELPEPWASADMELDPDWEWNSAAQDSGITLRSLWTERVAYSRSMVKEQIAKWGEDALSVQYSRGEGRSSVSLRWVVTHMIEEYARHNGHADLLRESIDGEMGE